MSAVLDLPVTETADPLRLRLIAQCALRPEDIALIERVQAADSIDFGAAALRLHLVTAEDLERARLALRRRAQPESKPQQGRRMLRPGPPPAAAPPQPPRPETGLATLPARASEEYAGLRTELLLRHDHHQGRSANVVAVLSPRAGEGRSQVAANLARSFARAGQATLLVDADLRRPSQHLRFNIKRDNGLVEALSEGRAPQIHAVDSAGMLFLLPAGGPTDSAVELLSSHTFEALLEDWMQRFAHIVLDSPPATEFPDAMALGTLARRALLVNRAQHTSVSACREMMRRLEATRVELLGAVVCHF
jgi:capsular exopolysaccharide synthesis family protein